MDKAKMIKAAYDLGFELERTYRGCAQCTVAAVQEILGIRNDWVFKAVGGLSGGCGLCGDGTCGGYSGGIVAMSLFFARNRDKFDDDREENYCSFRMAQELHERFVGKYGSVICGEIHVRLFGRRFDLRDKDEKKQFEEAGAHEDKCTSVVANASAWATEIILNEMQRRSLVPQDFSHLGCDPGPPPPVRAAPPAHAPRTPAGRRSSEPGSRSCGH